VKRKQGGKERKSGGRQSEFKYRQKKELRLKEQKREETGRV